MPKTLGSRCLNGLLVDPHGELATAFGLYFHARSMEILEATTPDPAELWLPADCDFALVADIGPEALRHVMRALLDQDDGLPIVVAGLRTIDDAVVAGKQRGEEDLRGKDRFSGPRTISGFPAFQRRNPWGIQAFSNRPRGKAA